MDPYDPESIERFFDNLGSSLVTPSATSAAAAAAAAAVLYVLSILLHELGHALAARAVGVKPDALHLGAFGGYVVLDDDDGLTAGRFAAITIAGPMVTALLALGFWAIQRTVESTASEDFLSSTETGIAVDAVLSIALYLNVIALVVNLLPVRPLDGGHLLSAARIRWGR